MTQLPLPIGLAPLQTFASFEVGANAAAVGAVQAVVQRAGAAADAGVPLYLWGLPGSGKTHLLRAAAAAIAQAGGAASPFDAGSPAPWQAADGSRLVLIDGCDVLDAVRQHAAFALFVDAASAGRTVIAAGRLPPVDLPVREDLRTRLGWGPVFQLQPPSDGDVQAVLRREAGRRGLVLDDPVVTYVLRHFARDLGSLMALLDALDRYALARQRGVTVPLIKAMLAEPPADGAPEQPA